VSDARIRTYPRIDDPRAATDDDRSVEMRSLHHGAFVDLDPAHELALVIDPAEDLGLEPRIQDGRVREEQVVLLPRVEPPRSERHAANVLALLHETRDCVRDLQLSPRRGLY